MKKIYDNKQYVYTFRLFLYFKQIECYIGHIYKRARICTTQYIFPMNSFIFNKPFSYS